MLPFDLLWEQYNRVVKDCGAIVLFSSGMFTADLMKSNPTMWRYNLVWDKVLVTGFLNAKRMPLRSHEDICVFYKKQPTYNPQKTKGKRSSSVGKAAGKTQDDVARNSNYRNFTKVNTTSDMKYPKSIKVFQKPHPSITVHPTQKPVELFEYLIKTYSNEGEWILDNCSGSGTTAIAAENLRRKWICIEKEEKYASESLRRIREHCERRGGILSEYMS